MSQWRSGAESQENTLEAILAIENSFETSLLVTEKSEIFQVKL